MHAHRQVHGRPSRGRRTAPLLLVVAGALSACTTSGIPVPQSATTSRTSCPPEVIGDPWIVFDSPLDPTDRLTVGEVGFVRTDAEVDEVAVSGDSAAVLLRNGSFVNTSDCGTRTTRMRWLEIEAVAPGRARISVPRIGSAPATVIMLTVQGS